MKKFLALTTFLIIIFSSIGKVYSIEADVFIQSTVNRAAKTLGGGLTKEERIVKLKNIARDTVDINGIGSILIAGSIPIEMMSKLNNITSYLNNTF